MKSIIVLIASLMLAACSSVKPTNSMDRMLDQTDGNALIVTHAVLIANPVTMDIQAEYAAAYCPLAIVCAGQRAGDLVITDNSFVLSNKGMVLLRIDRNEIKKITVPQPDNNRGGGVFVELNNGKTFAFMLYGDGFVGVVNIVNSIKK